MEKSEARRVQRVVLVPYPFQGHITPMLQLASILHEKGFSITVAHTNFNSPNPSDNPEFTFLPLSDNLDSNDVSFYNILNVLPVMNANCEGPFEEYLTRMQGEVVCIIYDSIMTFVDVVAKRLSVPTIVLRTTTAAFIHSYKVMFQLMEEELIPCPESQLLTAIPQVYPLRFKDLPLPATTQIPEIVLNFLRSYTDIRSSSAVIWNTIEALDHWPLQQLHQHTSVPFFSIGPFHKMSKEISSTSLIEEDNSCLLWLDKQAPNSVIFASLGSLAIIDEKELMEIAWGLAESEQPFLWIVRPSLVRDCSDPIESLPEDFKKLTRERGRVVKWAPQKKVLAHPAVGGFLTHCGWNSTLESMCEGVPLICRPCFADQIVNARYLTHVWRVGLELDNVGASSIAKAIRTLMVSEEGKITREKAFKLKKEIMRSVNKGGSAFESLDRLVDFIISLSGNK